MKVQVRDALLIALSGVVLIAFQNCTSQKGFGTNSIAESSVTSSASSQAGGVFPYDVSANALSYMSCPTANESPNKEAYYSFKLKAVDNTSFNTIVSSLKAYQQNGTIGSGVQILSQMADGGIRLNPDYLASADKALKGLKSQATTEQIMSHLQTLGDYKFARIEMSLRKRDDVRNIILHYPGSSGGDAALWVMDKLTTPLMSKAIASKRDTWTNNFPKSSVAPDSLNAIMNYSSASEADMGNYRALLQREYYLALTFNKNDGEGSTTIQHNAFPAGAAGVYGKGYTLNFAQPLKPVVIPNGANNYNSIDTVRGTQIPKPSSVVASGNGVFETNLATGEASAAAWSCISYGIVRYEDRDLCPVEEYNKIARDKLELARKFLRTEDWQVNTTMGCIVPTGSNASFSCYTTNTPNPSAEKSIWRTLLNQPVPLGFGTNYVDPAGTPLNTGIEYRYWSANCSGNFRECVNFATFCFKQK